MKLGISLLTSTLLVASLAYAAPSIAGCPFTDTFNISGPSGIAIEGTPQASGNVKYSNISPNEFELMCGNNQNGNSGTLAITIGSSDNNKCDLQFQDGPYMMNPIVSSSSCAGLQYAGMEHEFWSYQYTLRFLNA